nr:transposase [Lunatimonas salinarum]
MKDDHMKNGELKPAYNAQISTEIQFITHASIHQTPGDTTTLESHLEGFEEAYEKQSSELVADAGYGSEENYEMLGKKGAAAYVKYNYFHKEQKKKTKSNPFLPQNLFYNAKGDFYVCPMGQRMEKTGSGKRVSANGYESRVTYYQSRRCEGCPLRGLCHQGQGNRKIEVNHRLNELKATARELLTSERGLIHSSNRPIEPEAVFGQLKSNNKFNQFTFNGLEKVTMELMLMAIGHSLRKLVAAAVSPAKTVFTSPKPACITLHLGENHSFFPSMPLYIGNSNFSGISGRLAA